jgi:hypothetical protein
MATKKRKRSLAREGEPSQKTRKGLEIPVPTRDEFFRGVKRTIRKSSESAKSSH